MVDHDPAPIGPATAPLTRRRRSRVRVWASERLLVRLECPDGDAIRVHGAFVSGMQGLPRQR